MSAPNLRNCPFLVVGCGFSDIYMQAGPPVDTINLVAQKVNPKLSFQMRRSKSNYINLKLEKLPKARMRDKEEIEVFTHVYDTGCSLNIVFYP